VVPTLATLRLTLRPWRQADLEPFDYADLAATGGDTHSAIPLGIAWPHVLGIGRFGSRVTGASKKSAPGKLLSMLENGFRKAGRMLLRFWRLVNR